VGDLALQIPKLRAGSFRPRSSSPAAGSIRPCTR
jgi:hypothetical protein